MKKARKAKLDEAGLKGLGLDKLVTILLDEVAFNKALKTRLLAALAGGSGAEDVARLIDKRLDTLAKARSGLSIARANELAIELRGLLKNITTELATVDRFGAFERMLRYVVIGATVEARAYDGGAKLGKVLAEIHDSLAEVVLALDPAEQSRAVPLLEALRSRDEYGSFSDVLKRILCDMAEPAADAWKMLLSESMKASSSAKSKDLWRRSSPLMFLQALAAKRVDIDEYVILERSKPEERRDTLQVARMLLDAKRFAEALEWVRMPSGTMRVMDLGGGRFGMALGAQPSQAQRLLEAEILDGMKDKGASQAIRWAEFERSLDPGILRTYIAKLDDFAEFDETDKALALVTSSSRIYEALLFLLAWPRLDLASAHVLRHLNKWDGREYEVLLDAAEALGQDYPVAATMLYRTLMDDILRRGLSAAYPYAVGYLFALHELAPALPADFPYQGHAAYCLDLKTRHGRKYGFWQLVPEELK